MQGASSSNNVNMGPALNRNKNIIFLKYNNTVIDRIKSSDKQRDNAGTWSVSQVRQDLVRSCRRTDLVPVRRMPFGWLAIRLHNKH